MKKMIVELTAAQKRLPAAEQAKALAQIRQTVHAADKGLKAQEDAAKKRAAREKKKEQDRARTHQLATLGARLVMLIPALKGDPDNMVWPTDISRYFFSAKCHNGDVAWYIRVDADAVFKILAEDEQAKAKAEAEAKAKAKAEAETEAEAEGDDGDGAKSEPRDSQTDVVDAGGILWPS